MNLLRFRSRTFPEGKNLLSRKRAKGPQEGFVDYETLAERSTIHSRFTGLSGGAGHGVARDAFPDLGVGEHLHGVVGVRGERVQDRAECVTDFRLSAGLRVRRGAARCLVQ